MQQGTNRHAHPQEDTGRDQMFNVDGEIEPIGEVLQAVLFAAK